MCQTLCSEVFHLIVKRRGRIIDFIDSGETNMELLVPKVHHKPTNKIPSTLEEKIIQFARSHLLFNPATQGVYYPIYISSSKAFHALFESSNPSEKHVSTPTFLGRVKSVYPTIQAMPPSFACCSKCQLYGNSMYELRLDLAKCRDTANRKKLEKDQIRLRKALEEHLAESFEERKYYKQQIDNARHTETKLMLSIDFKMPIVYPSLRQVTQKVFFAKRPLAEVFGIVNEGIGTGVCDLFFYNNELKGHNWQRVVALVYNYLNKRIDGSSVEKLIIRSDNCANQNKNRFMFMFLAYILIKFKLKSIRLDCMVPGHTKFSCDRYFGLLSVNVKRNNCYSMTELSQVADRIGKRSNNVFGHVVRPKDLLDFDLFLRSNFKGACTKFNTSTSRHFKVFEKDKVVFIKNKVNPGDKWSNCKRLYPKNTKYGVFFGEKNIPSMTAVKLTDLSVYKSMVDVASYIPLQEDRNLYLQEISKFQPDQDDSISMEVEFEDEDDQLVIAGNIAVLPEETEGSFAIPELSFSLPAANDDVLPEAFPLADS